MNEQRMWRVFGWLDYEDYVLADSAEEAVDKVKTRCAKMGLSVASDFPWEVEEMIWDGDGFLRRKGRKS